MSDQRAIIDIGSNTVRLVVFGGPPRAPTVLLNEKVTARLGKGVAENGLLSDRAMASAHSTLARFAALLRLRDVKDVETVATAAVRDAGNGTQFLESVARLGLEPRLLSGEEEAVTSAMGVAAAFPGAKGVVADLGGGSLELTDIDGELCEHGISVPLGTLRLPQLRAGGAAKFARTVHKALQTADWSGGEGLPLYLVGGSYRALARFALHVARWPLDDPHGYELSPEAALTLCRSIGRSHLSGAPAGLSSSRLASLPDAAALLSALVREVRPSRLFFSAWGLREGLLYRSMARAARTQDPLLAGVAAFAEGIGIPAASAVLVADWTASANPGGTNGRENLRLAATMLALASHQIEPNLRSQHAADWALRKRWIGVDAEGRAVITAALIANTGRLELPAGLDRLAPQASLREGIAWGLAIRLCRRFSGISAQALANSSLSVEGPQLVLSVSEPLNALIANGVEKDMKLLAGELGLLPSMRLSRD